MKVSHSNNPVNPSDVQSGSKVKKEEGIPKHSEVRVTHPDADHGGARTDISPRAKEFIAAKQAAAAAPDVREDRVAEIKKKISEGKYNVDSKAVADRMVDEHMSTMLD